MRMKECQNGGGSSDLFSALRMSASAISRWKEWPTSKPGPSGCQLHNRKKPTHVLPHPAWVCWGKRTTFPQRSSRKLKITKWCGVKPLGLPLCGQRTLAHPLERKQTGPWACPWEPNWILPPWGPCRWPYLITQQWVRYNVSTNPRSFTRCPWPRHPYNWLCLNPQTNVTPLHGLRSSEQMQCSLTDPWATTPLLNC